MATCNITGTLLDVGGHPIVGATIKFLIADPTMDLAFLNLVMPKEAKTTSAADGTWTLAVERGLSGTISIQYPPSSVSGFLIQNFSVVVPDLSSAVFASIWEEAIGAILPPPGTQLTFGSISGQLDPSQFPPLPDTNIWIGNGTSLATPHPITGDIALSDTGVASISNLARSKLASGTAYRLIVNNSSGAMSENAALTATSVPYVDANGQLASDSNLKWDSSNHRLGIGGTPSNTLDVFGTIGATGNINVNAGTFTIMASSGNTASSGILELGGQAMMFGNVGSLPAITSETLVGRTSGGGSAPFNAAGSLVYAPRQSSTQASSSHYFYAGNPLAEVFRLNSSGGTLTGLLTVTGGLSGDISGATTTATGSTTARSLANRAADIFNVKDYGAVGNNVADDTTAIQAAITAASGVTGGATVFFPAGQYKCTSAINLLANVSLVGSGYLSSELIFNHTGDGLSYIGTLNNPDNLRLSITNISIIGTNLSNTGSGIRLTDGCLVKIDNVFVQKFKYGISLDQAEHILINFCELTQQFKACIWLTNGADLTPGASLYFTNHITIQNCSTSLVSSAGLYSILDDGGGVHNISNNSFSGGEYSCRFAGLSELVFDDNEMEGAATAPVLLTNITYNSSTPVSGIQESSFRANDVGGNGSTTAYGFVIDEVYNCSFENNIFWQFTSAAFGFNSDKIVGNRFSSNGKILTGAAKWDKPIFDSSRTANISKQNQFARTYSTYVASGLSAGSVTVTPKTMEGISIGETLFVQNADGTNSETVLVTNTAPTTFTATFASNKSANWILNTGSGFTAGSIPFSNGSELYENNNKLFWDSTNNRLGIGTNAPILDLEISKALPGTTFMGLQVSDTTSQNYIRTGVLRPGSGAGTYAGIWTSFDPPDLTNYRLLDTGGGVALNADSGTQIDFKVNAATKMRLASSGGLALGSSYYSTDPGANNLIIQGKVGIGTNSISSVGLDVRTSVSGTGTTQVGFQVNPTYGVDATHAIYGGNIAPSVPAGSQTVSSVYGLNINGVSVGSGATVNNYYGLLLAATGGAGTIVNKWGIFQDAADNNVLYGNTIIGAQSAPTATLDVRGTGHFTGALTLDTPLAVASGGTGLTSTSPSYVFSGPNYPAGSPAAPTWKQLNTGDISLTNIIGNPTMPILEHHLNHISSATVIERGGITDNGDGTVNLATADVHIRSSIAVSSLTQSGGTATVVTAADHNLLTGYKAMIRGANQSDYNGIFYVTVVDNVTFTYPVFNSPVTPATGSIFVSSEQYPIYTAVAPAATNVSLTDHSVNYIFVDYNAGSPIFNVTTDFTQIYGLARVVAWVVAREGTKLWIVDARGIGVDTANKSDTRNIAVEAFRHEQGGTVLSGSGTRNIAVTKGAFWYGLNRAIHAAFDTSGSDVFRTAYTSDSGSTWTYTTSQQQISNTQYNSIASGLASLTVGNYGVFWVYMMNNAPSDLLVLYGQGDYTKSDAFAAQEPTVKPAVVTAVGALIGKIIIQQGASSFTNVYSIFKAIFPNPAPDLSSLSDVLTTNPSVGQVLAFNGSEWVNSPATTVSAGAGVNFYNATPIIDATGTNNANQLGTLSGTPITTAEQTTVSSLTSNTLLNSAWRTSAALNRTSLDAGTWNMTVYAGVNSVAGGRVTTVTKNIYQIIPGATGGYTVTTTGSGTSRTATASGASFVSGDANATNTSAGYLETPQGLYQITAFTSTTVVTIAVPSTYANETGVQFKKWARLFGATSQAITAISPNYLPFLISATESSFTIATTDYLGTILFGTSNNTTTLTVTYNGTAHNSFINSPLTIQHNNLVGLQGGTAGEYYHLTSAEYTGTGTGAFARKDSPVFTTNVTSPLFTGDLTGNVTGNTSGSSGSCTGNAATASVATQVTATATSTNASYYPTFVASSSTGSQGIGMDGDLTYNPSTNTLTAGAFSGPLTGNVTGNVTGSSGSCTGNAATATTATNANNSAIVDDTTTNATMYPLWVTTTTGNLPLKVSSSKLTFNPSTATLTTTTFAGALSGNATTATTATNVSGGSVSATTIAGTDTTDSTTTGTGALTVAGGVGIAKKVTIGSGVSIAQTSVNNYIGTGTGWIWTSTGLSSGTVGGGIYANGGTPALYLFGGNTITDHLHITSTGLLVAANTTDSTSSTTGALTLAGGLGVAKAVVTGTTLTVGTYLTVNGTVPAHNTSAGTAGQIAVDASYIYYCIASGNWTRVAWAGGTW